MIGNKDLSSNRGDHKFAYMELSWYTVRDIGHSQKTGPEYQVKLGMNLFIHALTSTAFIQTIIKVMA